MQRVTGLDGVRGCAILWVLLYHFFALVPKAPWVAAIPLVGPLADFGWIGVNLFFALSGYLIIPLLAAQRDDPNYYRRFWCRRAFRLVPVYLLCLISYGVAVALWPDASPDRQRLLDPAIPLWTYWALVQNVWMSARNYMGGEWLRVTWSLAVEVQFYALIAVMVRMMPRPRLVPMLAVLTAAVVLFRYAVVFLNPGSAAPIVLLLPCRLDAFLLGGLAALLPGPVPGGEGRRRLLAWIALAGSVAAFGWFAHGGFGGATRLVLPLYYLMLSVGCSAVLDLSVRSAAPVRWLMQNAVMVRAGQLSYFVYLFHLPVLWTVYQLGSGGAPSLAQGRGVGLMLVVLGVLYGLAELSYRWLEAPLIERSHGYFRRVGRVEGARADSR